jgi:hypothetical protein
MMNASIKFRTHAVSITIQDDGHINCFKHTHNNELCEYETFDSYSAAEDYIIKPFSLDRWVLEMHD